MKGKRDRRRSERSESGARRTAKNADSRGLSLSDGRGLWVLLEATAGMVNDLDLSRVFQRVHRIARALTGLTRSHVFLLDENRRLTLQSVTPLTRELDQESLRALKRVLRDVVRTGCTVAIEGCESSRARHALALRKIRVEGFLALPLKVRNRVTGVLCLDGDTCPNGRLSPPIVQRMELVAKHVAMTVENSRLYEKARDSTLELKALLETSRTLSHTLELNKALQVISRQAARLLAVDVSSLFILNGETNELHGAAGFGIRWRDMAII